jgi:cation-transporting ATPase 13A2
MDNFPEALVRFCDQYTKTGFRVIAIASRRLTEAEVEMSTDEPEEFFYNNLNLGGVIVFENAIKEGTVAMVRELRNCKIQMAIISGDNEYSCAYNAFKIGIIHKSEPLFFINFNHNSKKLTVIKIRYKGGNLDIRELDNKDNDLIGYLSEIFSDVNDNYTMIEGVSNESHILKGESCLPKALVSTKEYHFMLNNSSIEFLKSENFLESNILAKTRVFARMIPSSKAEVLSVYKSMLKHDHRIAFVGDGSNDVRAMKIADVGVSFLGCEASISAGFSIPFEKINQLPLIFAEGKACLETCAELFKYICFYSLLLFVACIILYLSNVDFSNGMYYVMDLLIIIPLSIFMCFHGSEKLVPKFPICTLFTKEIIFGLAGHWVIFIISSLITALQLHSIAIAHDLAFGSVIFGMFLISYIDITLMCLIFTKSHPFRVSVMSNKWYVWHLVLCVLIFFFIAYGSEMEFIDPAVRWFDDVFAVG